MARGCWMDSDALARARNIRSKTTNRAASKPGTRKSVVHYLELPQLAICVHRSVVLAN